MASSTCLFVGTTVIRSPQKFCSLSHLYLPKPLTPRPSHHFYKSYVSFYSYSSCSSSTAIQIATPSDASSSFQQQPPHPWPEWVTFIDRLKSKGYLIKTTSLGDISGNSVDDDGAPAYKDMNFLKDACLSFARDRFDIFKSLTRDDIQTIVKVGCPNLLRKVVNSEKRLRAYVGLDEGDVCASCDLRESCDRAYVILKESEAAARTVDIMHILLFYALDPLVLSGGIKPPGREQTESSVRRLLSELLELSEESPDAAVSQPAVKISYQKQKVVNLMDNKLSQKINAKGGDWTCPKCNFLNFARNAKCIKCNEDAPRAISVQEVEVKKGDWICPGCKFVNFSRNTCCRECETERPYTVPTKDITMKKGDWNCPQCGYMNFASNTKCFRCPEPRPPRQLKPGDWECLLCDFLNYRRNPVCLKCKCKRPKEVATQYEDQVWKKPL